MCIRDRLAPEPGVARRGQGRRKPSKILNTWKWFTEGCVLTQASGGDWCGSSLDPPRETPE
eukprot:9360578-Pyramimonas_sp.AAC.1